MDTNNEKQYNFSANKVLVAKFLLKLQHHPDLFEQYKQQDFLKSLNDDYFEGSVNRGGILKSIKDLLYGKKLADNRLTAHHNKMATLLFGGATYNQFLEDFEKNPTNEDFIITGDDAKKIDKLTKNIFKTPFLFANANKSLIKDKKVDKQTLRFADILIGEYFGYFIDSDQPETKILGLKDEISIYLEDEQLKVYWLSVDTKDIKTAYTGIIKVIDGRLYIDLLNELETKKAFLILHFDVPPVSKKNMQILTGASMGMNRNQIIVSKTLLVKKDFDDVVKEHEIIKFLTSDNVSFFHTTIPNSFTVNDFLPEYARRSQDIESQNNTYIAENFAGLYYVYGSGASEENNMNANLFWVCACEIKENGSEIRVSGTENNFVGSVQKIGNDLKINMWQATSEFKKMATENMIQITIKIQDITNFDILCGFATSKSSRNSDFGTTKIIFQRIKKSIISAKKEPIFPFKKIFYKHSEIQEYYETLTEKNEDEKELKKGFYNIAQFYLNNYAVTPFLPRFSHHRLQSTEYKEMWKKLKNPQKYMGFRFDVARGAIAQVLLEISDFHIKYMGIDRNYNLKMEIELDDVIIFNAEDAYKYSTKYVLRIYDNNIIKGITSRIDHENKMPVARQIIFVPYKESEISFEKMVYYIGNPKHQEQLLKMIELYPEIMPFLKGKDNQSKYILPNAEFQDEFIAWIGGKKEVKD